MERRGARSQTGCDAQFGHWRSSQRLQRLAPLINKFTGPTTTYDLLDIINLRSSRERRRSGQWNW